MRASASTRRHVDHAAYMQSPRWEARKARYFRAHRRRCHLCDGEHRIHLHHLSYEHLGDEPDGDLMPLCESCHELVHLYAKQRPTLELRDATMFAIAHIRAGRVEVRPRVDAWETWKQQERARRLEAQQRARAQRRAPVRVNGQKITVAGDGRRRPHQNT